MTVHKIKLHTYQDPSVLEAINKTGVYYAQTDVMMDKYKNCVDMYQPVYDWLIRASCRRVRKPEKVEFVTHTDITSYHQVFTWQLKKEWIVSTGIIE